MSDELVHLQRRPDGVALVTLDRPKANALSLPLLRQLAAVFEELAADLPGAVVIWGGPRIFAAGADIAGFGGPEEAAVIGREFRVAFDRVAALPRVVLAAVCGYALGGGCELALACDLRIVADTAKLGQPEIQLGIIPGAGGTQRLPRLIGAARAKDLVLTGRHVDADEALRIGLADRVVPADQVLDTALELAAALAAGPLVAQQSAKLAIDLGAEASLADGLDLESRLFVEVFGTEDAREGIRSFLEHGPGRARFRGR
ncbi:enoyl-CoA hydratase/isomerase family protein [Acidimicrobiaceae bacterium USS-CC1]|uniref:Enoyl-CoA hydratase/isomerase family protein n=1 Tax=Acidiferrimicrobium australe TaxID=2664430 RepID=A0ABW9QRU3_9ACTN|nr:enoyl-CoA hydratase/isomerase family protein [Acidiferrimicrobium australe]